jgi:hypothetical protein
VSEIVRKILGAILVLPKQRVFRSADHSAADRTLDRAGAAREQAAEVVQKVFGLLFRR